MSLQNHPNNSPDKTFENWKERYNYIFDAPSPPAPTYNEFIGDTEYYNFLTTEEAIIFCLIIQESRK